MYHHLNTFRSGGTMTRLFAAVLSPNNQIFHSVQTDWRFTDSCPPESKIICSISPCPAFPTDATPRTPSVLGGPRRDEETPWVPKNLGGARARRRRHQNGADCAPPPTEHPPDEHAEVRVPAPSISRKSEISYRVPVCASSREERRSASGDKSILEIRKGLYAPMADRPQLRC